MASALQGKISVIVPVYNVQKYLEKCVCSILAQTYKELEVLLVDDGSPDDCGEICDRLAETDPRILVIHKENGGLSSARNAGIDACTGDYISFIDSDDDLSPDFYEKLLKALVENGADLSLCDYQLTYEDGRSPVTESTFHAGVFSSREIFQFFSQPCYVRYVVSTTKLYKRELFATLRFPEGKLHEDEFTAHHILGSCHVIAAIPDQLYHYLQRSQSIMTQDFKPKHLHKAEALLDRYAYFKSIGEARMAKDTLCYCYIFLREALDRLKEVPNREFVLPYLLDTLRLLVKEKNRRAVSLFLIILKEFSPSLLSQMKFRLRAARQKARARAAGNPVIFLMNTPVHGNLGDQAIVYAQKQILSQWYPGLEQIEVRTWDYDLSLPFLKKLCTPEDLIVIDGGGSMGTLWPEDDDRIRETIEHFSRNPIVVFPQTCYYQGGSGRLKKNAAAYKAAERLTLLLRDEPSYEFVKENFPGVRAYLVPDIVLSLSLPQTEKKRRGVLFCLRNDREQNSASGLLTAFREQLEAQGIPCRDTDTVLQQVITCSSRDQALQNKWDEFRQAELVITDRLHGMEFAAITGTPCIALDNVSHKIKGGYQWIRELSYVRFLEDPALLEKTFREMYPCEKNAYDFSYPDLSEYIDFSPAKTAGAAK